MKDNKTLILAAIWIASLAFFLYFQKRNTPQVPPPIQTLIAQAQKEELAAKGDTKKLKGVAGKYLSIGTAKAYQTTEEAAQARLHSGELYEKKIKDDTRAVDVYTKLVADYSKTESISANEAKVRLEALKKRMTEKRSSEIGYKAIDWLVALTGRNPEYSYALALLIITLIFKIVTTPLSHAQYKSMREMQKIQPLMKELQAKYKDNQQEQGKKMMELYKEHGVNPLSGCLPLLVQMPILIGLYRYVISPYQFQFSQGHFLWIGSGLSRLYPSLVGTDLSMPDIPLVIIYTISMIWSQKLSVVDPNQGPEQKMMMYMMPLMFAFMFKGFPSAFMLYWLFFNVISTTQQYYILKHPSGGGGAAGVTDGGIVKVPVGPAEPKKSTVAPGSKSNKRKKRFQIAPRITVQPTPGG